MPEVVYIVAEERYEGDLSALSRTAHVWVRLTEYNAARYSEAVDRDGRAYSPHYGLSGFHDRGGARESVYQCLGTIDEHHDDDARWEELRIIGLAASEFDGERMQRELEVGPISLSQEHGYAIIRRAS